MKISVIMPSFLGQYEGAATDRKKKFCRAVDSFLRQNYENKELIIVADGCQETADICKNKYSKYKAVKLITIEKQPLFSGNVRQAGINAATGKVICYLDTDDLFGASHLSNICSQINGFDWVYFNDFLYIGYVSDCQMRQVELKHEKIGTSAIAHKSNLRMSWTGCDGYGHDWAFIQKLMQHKNNAKIFGCQYYVGHVKGRTDF